MKMAFVTFSALAIALPAAAQIPFVDPSKVIPAVLDSIDRASAADAAEQALSREGVAVVGGAKSIDVAANGLAGFLVRAKTEGATCFVTVKKLSDTPEHGMIPMQATDSVCVPGKH